jgi:hypothetical protein
MPSGRKLKRNLGEQPSGLKLERTVARIQQMMDPNSTVSHDEWLEDRVGNRRQYDVIIRGKFGGRSLLGVIECKDHNRKKGPDAIEAFAKKTENLCANLRLIVSRKGFTAQALKLAKHEGIGCLSLLSGSAEQLGFSIGQMWYGIHSLWKTYCLIVHFEGTTPPILEFDSGTVKWQGKPVLNWFRKQLLIDHADEVREGEHYLSLMFDSSRMIEIEGQEYLVKGLSCKAIRIHRKKQKWVSWSGDALYDWHSGRMTIPPNGEVYGSSVETDLDAWSDFEGEIPEAENPLDAGLVQAILRTTQSWDESLDSETPDLEVL